MIPMNHINDGDYNKMVAGADPTPPFLPPVKSCIASTGIVLLAMLICFIFIILTFEVFIYCLATINLIDIEYLFGGVNEDMEEDFDLEDDEKAVKFLEAFLRAVKGKEERGGRKERRRRRRDEWKNDAEGSIECFGSEEIAESGYRECSICMDEFQRGDKCLVFPGCGHIFHCKCIVRWVRKKKLTCPVCRSRVNMRNTNGTRGFRRSSWAQP